MNKKAQKIMVCLRSFICTSLKGWPILSFRHSFVETNYENFNQEKGKDKRYTRNWRPKSLINVDAKVASKCLASRP